MRGSKSLGLSVLGLGIVGQLAIASEARAASCAYEAGAQTVTVSILGDLAKLAVSPSGAITMNSVPCGAATTSNVSNIVVSGALFDDRLTLDLTLPFQPGTELTSGPGDLREINISVNLGFGRNTVLVTGSASADQITIGSAGMNLNADGDADVSFANVHVFEVQGLGGNDIISAQGGAGTGTPFIQALTLTGGDGADILAGGEGADALYGGDGTDSLFGHGGNDTIIGNNDADYEDGGAGNDFFNEGALCNGDDTFVGGAGVDVISYARRTSPVVVILSGNAESGDVYGEMDTIATDIENGYGGSQDDYMIGNGDKNELHGLGGTDWIEGGANADIIYGGDGDDHLFGNDGADTINGGNGTDYLFGGADADNLYGNDGDDMLNGEAGNDNFYCGNGTDTINDQSRGTVNLCELS